MKWLTRENIGIDRMGCAWLIRRFIDPQAEFIFVPKGTTPLPAGAEPFDLPDVRYSHRQGHCSFHTLLDEFKLDDPVLQRIARIIDEADTVQEVLVEPASQGLDLLCRGLRLTAANDFEAVDHGCRLYDGLYAALKMEMAAAR